MTHIKSFWKLFIEQGLQVPDAKISSRLWYVLLDAEDIPNKQARLFQLSRLADVDPRNGPSSWRHFFTAFDPQLMVMLAERAVQLRRLSRHQANLVEERVLRQTTAQGQWDLLNII